MIEPSTRPQPGMLVTPTRRALFFLLVCSPIYLAPRMFAVAHAGVWLAVTLGVTHAFLRSEGRTLAVIGIEPSWRRLRELFAGWAGGAVLILLVTAGAWLALPFPWVRNPLFSISAAAFSAAWLLVGNAVEEILFRGYSFERLIAGIGHWRAQLVTALIFAAFHLAQGWAWQTALVGTTIGSLFFGLVFVRWGSLPAAVGVHAATNWARDLLFLDPPTAETLFGPLSPRPWTSSEQLIAMAIFDGLILLACAALWRSIRRNPSRVLPAMHEFDRRTDG